PAITTLVLLFYIAAWAIVMGALEIAAAIRLRREIQGEFWMIFAGLLSVAFGVLVLAFPGAGALAALFYIGAWALLSGLAQIFLSFRLRSFVKELGEPPGRPQVGAPAH